MDSKPAWHAGPAFQRAVSIPTVPLAVRFGRVEPISETREWAVDGSAAATAMRGIAEELLGVPATIIQGMCHSNLLLQRLDESGVALRHLGRSPLSVHRSYCLRADHLFNGGVDEAVNRFKPNEEAIGVILVPLQYLSGASGETRVTDVDGHRWSLRGSRPEETCIFAFAAAVTQR